MGFPFHPVGSRFSSDYPSFLEAAGLKLTDEEAQQNKAGQTRLLEAKALALGLPSRLFFKNLPVSCLASSDTPHPAGRPHASANHLVYICNPVCRCLCRQKQS